MSFTLTLLGAAAFGLAYQSGTLLNGWRDRRSRERIQNDSQAFQGELEAKRQAFQAALAEKNFQQSAQLQREITAMKATFDRQMQEARFEHDLEMWNMNQFVNNVWPLINTPDGYVHFLKQNGYPMSVIMTGKLDGGILSSASAFINEFYANHQQIYYYNQGWKENMLKRQGNAQRDALHQGLNGLPTLVVMPDIENGDFKLDVAFWGFGESMPQTVSVFKRNYQQMEAEILRNIAQENKNTVFPPISNPMILSIQANIETLRQEEEYRQNLRAQGMAEEEIEALCNRFFVSVYKKNGLEADVAGGICQIVGASISIIAGQYADAFLLGTGSAPKLPALMKKFPKSVQDEMGPQLVRFYSELTEMMDELERPKACAFIASAYAEGDDTKNAQHFQKAALEELQKYYSRKQPLAMPHWEAVEIIRKKPLFGTSEFPYLLAEASKPKDLDKTVGIPFSGNRKAGDRMVKTVNGIEYAFRWCPAGSFLMGSPEDEPDRWSNETQHSVTLTRGFWMLETEVTQAMWKSVMGTDPSYFKGAQNPVESVSWDDCQEFCGKLSSKLGLTVSLPTEAQWEYACRAGTTSAYSFGSSLNGREANCDGNYPYGTSTKGPYLEKTVPVKSYAPNTWGLYDMHGNVWEWCQDWYDEDYYAESPTSDPTGPSSGSNRVFRGGCWGSIARYCRSANRYGVTPDNRGCDLGFRPVLASPVPEE